MNNFIIKEIYKDISEGLEYKKIKFRFSPEPNGVLHIGHVKAIYINFELAKHFNSKINLRFDDTNPKNENIFFVKHIINNIRWLGYRWDKITFASDYFLILYKFAKKLIINKKAYIEYINKNKSNYIYDVDKVLYYFKNMKLGKYNENEYILRANLKYDLPNYHLKDPIMYRIIKYKHYKTGYKWSIYPTYDWAHGQCDYIENITHSLCSIEFQNHKKLYDWYISNIYNKTINKYKPKQIEFSRLNIKDTITSKRQLNFLIEKKIIKNYGDPRLSTLISLKNKGYKNFQILDFINKIGFTKRNTQIKIDYLNTYIKPQIIQSCPILMVIFNPLKIIITNFKDKYFKWIYINNYRIKFTKYIYIEYNDFKLNHDNNFFRLSLKNYVRLKYAYIIKSYKITKIKERISKVYCKIYKNINNKKIKSTIQWVNCIFLEKIKIINYKYIYIKNKKIYNKNSLYIQKGYIDKNCLNNLKIKTLYQFLRIGFFYYFKKKNFVKFLFFKKQY
ncbi:MAG: glutamate--tRNA ligase family protein [Candidatus Shikimatogenerans sp. JK-2022]|nr:glutamate--tRNA ligase family protein [Candidatus Shikimatogenerans bostrichidophilus]